MRIISLFINKRNKPRDLFPFCIPLAGSSHRPPEISSVLSAITSKATPAESATRPTSSNSMTADESFGYQSLPARYRRRLLTQEEIDYIEVSLIISS